MTELRQAVFQFSQLKFSKKLEITKQLDLLEKSDKFVPDFERFRKVFDRANELGQLDKLIKAISKAYNEVN